MSVNPIYHHTVDKLRQEQRWIKRAKEDSKAFEPLYTKYHEQIFRYVYQRMDDKELAGDITSQVFLKALNNLYRYEFRGVPFASWLYRIAKSELYQSFRDKKVQRTISVESMNLFEMIEEMEEDVSEENKNSLLKVISQLKEEEVQLIEMRYFEKRSFREIGEILEITENNAKVKSHRIIGKMKRIFAKQNILRRA